MYSGSKIEVVISKYIDLHKIKEFQDFHKLVGFIDF